MQIRNPLNMRHAELARLVQNMLQRLYYDGYRQVYRPPGLEDWQSDPGTAVQILNSLHDALAKFGLAPSDECIMDSPGEPTPFWCTCESGPARYTIQTVEVCPAGARSDIRCEHYLCRECGGILEMGQSGTLTRLEPYP